MTGNDLRALRKELGLSQAKMAQKMGLSRRTYMRREELGEEEIPLAEATHAQVLARLLKRRGAD